MPPAANPFPILLLDGGLGTTLEDAHSIKFNDNTPLWSSDLLITSPETLVAAHKSFVDAGIDILLSATYQASYEGFERTRRERNGVEGDAGVGGKGGKGEEVEGEGEKGEGEGYTSSEAESYMRSAIPLAHQAFTSPSPSTTTTPPIPKPSKEPKIALSLGAYGATMTPSQEYTGAYDPSHKTTQQLRDWHRKRIDIFQTDAETWYGVDYVAFETIPLLEEIVAVREAVFSSEGGWDRRFWVSCVFPDKSGSLDGRGDKGELKLPDGSTVEEVVLAMLAGGPETGKAFPFGIGINCTKIGKLKALILEFERAVEKAVQEGKVDLVGWPVLVLYPDGAEGLVYDTESHIWVSKCAAEGGKDAPVPWDEAVFDIVKEVKERGKWGGLIVGGCCKVLPRDIAKLRKRIDGLE